MTKITFKFHLVNKQISCSKKVINEKRSKGYFLNLFAALQTRLHVLK